MRDGEWHQFDFWIGDWECLWADGGRGSNTVRAVLDGFVIEERFESMPPSNLRGMSVSTYSPSLPGWRQTWVDNAGNYFDLAGGVEGGSMVLSCDEPGTTAKLRMVFSNLEGDRFDWRWERSEDAGRSWTALWEIAYRRKGLGDHQDSHLGGSAPSS